MLDIKNIFITGCSYVEYLNNEMQHRKLKWYEKLYIWYYNNFEYIILICGSILLLIILYYHFTNNTQNGGNIEAQTVNLNNISGESSGDNKAIEQMEKLAKNKQKLKEDAKLALMTPEQQKAYIKKKEHLAFKKKKKEVKKMRKMTPTERNQYLKEKQDTEYKNRIDKRYKQIDKYKRSRSYKRDTIQIDKRRVAQDKLAEKTKIMKDLGVSNSEIEAYRKKKERKYDKKFRTSSQRKEQQLKRKIESNKQKLQNKQAKLKSKNKSTLPSKQLNVKQNLQNKQSKDKQRINKQSTNKMLSNKKQLPIKSLSKQKSLSQSNIKSSYSQFTNRNTNTDMNRVTNFATSSFMSIGGEMYKFIFIIFITIALGIFIFPTIVLAILGFLTFIIAKNHIINIITL